MFSDIAIHEVSGWLRELEFMLMEVSFLKTRLAHVVDNASDQNDIKNAEEFQEKFLQFDDKVKSLLSELKKHHDEMVFDKTHFPDNALNIKDAHKSATASVEQLIMDWAVLRKQFNGWVINLIWPG